MNLGAFVALYVAARVGKSATRLRLVAPAACLKAWNGHAAFTSLVSDDLQRDGLQHRASTIAGIEFVQDGGDVVLYRALGQVDGTADFAVGVAAGDQAQDFDLAVGKCIDRSAESPTGY